MKIRFTITRMIFVSLLSIAMILTSCKKNDESASDDTTAPTATTSAATMVGQRWATLNGTVNANNQIAEITFEYDTTDSYRYSIKGDPDTVSGNISTKVSANLSGLMPGTTYHHRVKAASLSDTAYGSDKTFTTTDISETVIIFNPDLNYGSVVDIDGNIYKTIQIGTQTWMAENLKAVAFNDGTSIPFITDGSTWADLSTPGYCWYNNDSVSYGGLYNWYAVDTASNGSKNVCPTGWHVPTDIEWTTLTTFLGGENLAGSKLKEIGTTHWYITNSLATNETGFTAIPGGYRNYSGTFNSIGRYSYWWSSTEAALSDAYCRDINYSYNNLERGMSIKKSGLSVRCIQNNKSGK